MVRLPPSVSAKDASPAASGTVAPSADTHETVKENGPNDAHRRRSVHVLGDRESRQFVVVDDRDRLRVH